MAGCAVNVLASVGGVAPDLLSEELFARDGLSVALVGVVVAFRSGAVEHSITKRRIQLGEATVVFVLEVLLAEAGVEDPRVVNETVT